MNIKIKKTFSIICLSFLLASFGFGLDNTMTLIIGQNHSINPGFNIGNVSIGNPGFCDFIVNKSRTEVVLIPRGKGTTNLILWDRDGKKQETTQIIVVANLRGLFQELKDLFSNITGLRMEIKSSRIFIEGNIFSLRDYDFILNSTKGFSDLVISRVRLDPEAMKLIASEIQKAINRTEIEVKVVKDKIVLDGKVYSKSQYDRALKIAQTISSNRIIDALELVKDGRYYKKDKLVHFDIKFMEISNERIKRYGLNWSDSIGAESEYRMVNSKDAVTDKNETQTSYEAVLSGIAPALDILDRDGEAKTLLNPRLIVKNGASAKEVVDGGEYPVIYSTFQGVIIEYKEYGIIVEVTPIIANDNSVDVDIKISIIALGDPVVSQGISAPIFNKNEVHTNVFLEPGQTLALGGLISRTFDDAFSGWPLLSKIPLIKYLFGSKDYVNKYTDLIIFVTPTVIKKGSLKDSVDNNLYEKIKNNIMEEYSESL